MGVFWRLYRLSSFFFFALEEKGKGGYRGCVDKTLAAMSRIGSNKSEKLKRDEKQDEYTVSTSKNVILASSSSSEHASNADDTLSRYDGKCFTKATKSKPTYPYTR